MPHQSGANDFCALADVKTYVFRGGGNATLTDDDLIQRMITALSQSIEKDLSRGIKAANYTEVRSGTGTQIMFVKNPPIISVTSLYINGLLIPPKSTDVTQYMNGIGYGISEKYVSLFGYSFNRGLDNIQITYRGGYNSVPSDLEQSCIEAVALAYKELDRIGYVSKSLAGETVTFSIQAMSHRAKEIVDRYKRVIPL